MAEFDGLGSRELFKVIGYERLCLSGDCLCVPILCAFIDNDGVVGVDMSHGGEALPSSTVRSVTVGSKGCQ